MVSLLCINFKPNCFARIFTIIVYFHCSYAFFLLPASHCQFRTRQEVFLAAFLLKKKIIFPVHKLSKAFLSYIQTGLESSPDPSHDYISGLNGLLLKNFIFLISLRQLIRLVMELHILSKHSYIRINYSLID